MKKNRLHIWGGGGEVLFYFTFWKKKKMVKFSEKWVTITASNMWVCTYVQAYVMPNIYRRLTIENHFDSIYTYKKQNIYLKAKSIYDTMPSHSGPKILAYPSIEA